MKFSFQQVLCIVTDPNQGDSEPKLMHLQPSFALQGWC